MINVSCKFAKRVLLREFTKAESAIARINNETIKSDPRESSYWRLTGRRWRGRKDEKAKLNFIRSVYSKGRRSPDLIEDSFSSTTRYSRFSSTPFHYFFFLSFLVRFIAHRARRTTSASGHSGWAVKQPANYTTRGRTANRCFSTRAASLPAPCLESCDDLARRILRR